MNNFKSFDSFEEGIAELCKLVPNVKEYIKDGQTDQQDVISNLVDVVKNNIPSIYNPEYPATYSLSVSAHEVGFKTRSYYSFGWRVKIDNENNKITYDFRISFNDHNRPAIKNKNEEMLIEAGWRSMPIMPRKYNNTKPTSAAVPTVKPDTQDKE